MDIVEIKKYEDKTWGFIYVAPRCEKKVAEKIKGSRHICYLPTVPHAYMMHYTKVVTQIPMFPSYLFVCLGREDATDLRYANKQILKTQLLFDKEREDVFIRELQALQKVEELAKNKPILINPGIQKGDKILITKGELKGLETDVIHRDDNNNSIIINITILDKNIEYSVPAGDLKKLTS